MEEERREDTTKYGEFVCSTYRWLPIDVQREKAEKLTTVTEKSNDIKK